MPFTDVGAEQLEMLTNAFGQIILLSPAKALVPGHMQAWVQKDLLDIRYAKGIDQAQLLSAIQSYKSWADLHQDRIGDMAGFFTSQQGRFPMVEETNPTQIRHQVRHYGESSPDDLVDPVFKAALFLSMAQAYDAHQREIGRDMHAVHAMEQQMLKQLSGEHSEAVNENPIIGKADPPSSNQALDPYMIAQRVASWARLATFNVQNVLAYLTFSKTAIEHVLDLFPEAVQVLNWGLVSHQNELMQPVSRIKEIIQGLAFDPDPHACEKDLDDPFPSMACKQRLAIFLLPEVSSHRFLTRLSASDDNGKINRERQSGEPVHTLVGLVSTG
jgi:hypothetical protein